MSVIETNNLGHRYRSVRAVDGVDLELDRGSIFALLGPNGAGKTTTIKMLMGLIRPSSGQSKIFGVKSHKLGRPEWERIGYVSEDQELPPGLTVSGLMAFCSRMYPAWDFDFCDRLLDQFTMPRDRKLRALSRGMRMKASLISSIAYRPELLVLDEPFGGLDPVVREDFIEGILELTEQENWTVFLSSHDMEEVERLTDRLGIIANGRMILNEPVEALQQRFRRVEVDLVDEVEPPGHIPANWRRLRISGKRAAFVDTEFEAAASEKAVATVFPECRNVEVFKMNLREIYLAVARDEESAANSWNQANNEE
ncbi:MAG: ABC transporter ATP-binding protein [Verrucomicrobiota bacterium]